MTSAQSGSALRVNGDTNGNSMAPAPSEHRVDAAESLFAVFVALALVTVYTPLRTLHSLLTWKLIALLPLATYQDLGLIVVLAWGFHGLFALARRQRARRAIAVVGWTLCLTL